VHISGALKVVGVAAREFTTLEQVDGKHRQKVEAREKRGQNKQRHVINANVNKEW
jgi:hypothetical protein